MLTHAARAAAGQLNKPFQPPLVAARGARVGLWLEQSSFETRALGKAISTKQDVIRNLREQFDSAPEVDWHLYSTPNWTNLNKHGQELRKKLDWLKHLSDTRFKHLPAKGEEKEEMARAKRTRTAEYKKAKNRSKREKRKMKRMQRRIDLVKEENLVFNLIDPAEVEVPDAALAVLSYGEGFVPTPKFDDHQFRLEAHNASNKLERLANTLARESRQPSVVNDTEEEQQQLTAQGITVQGCLSTSRQRPP